MQRRKSSSQEPAEGSGGCARPVAEWGPWCRCSQTVPAHFPGPGGGSCLLWHLKLPLTQGNSSRLRGSAFPGRLKGVLSLFSKECSALQDFPPSQSLPFIGSAKIIWGSHRPFWTKSCEEDHGEIPDPQMHTRQMVPSRSILKPQLISLYVWASDVVLNTGLTPSGWAREVGHEQRVLTPHWP